MYYCIGIKKVDVNINNYLVLSVNTGVQDCLTEKLIKDYTKTEVITQYWKVITGIPEAR